MKKVLAIFSLIFILFSCNNTTNMTKELQNGDVVATLKTTKGQVEILLETEKAPFTTANFIGLAKKGYYDGVIFHRVMKDFMIQAGDPEGTGFGGESLYGEEFIDEFDSSLSNVEGFVSMANTGDPNTNGSQFFISVADNSYLDNKHTVFGEVISGMENVVNISKVKTDENDKPEKEIKIINVKINQYKDGKFVDYEFYEEEAIKNYKDYLANFKDEPVKAGDKVSVHYTGTFENGEKFDSSLDRGQTLDFTVGAGQMISGFDEAVIGMKIGEKKSITLPPEKAYGEYNPENVQVLNKSELQDFVNAGIELVEGAVLPTIYGRLSILKVEGDNVTIDLNHEMAGKTLNFEIELVNKK